MNLSIFINSFKQFLTFSYKTIKQLNIEINI